MIQQPTLPKNAKLTSAVPHKEISYSLVTIPTAYISNSLGEPNLFFLQTILGQHIDVQLYSYSKQNEYAVLKLQLAEQCTTHGAKLMYSTVLYALKNLIKNQVFYTQVTHCFA